jgi:hypothetical protein
MWPTPLARGFLSATLVRSVRLNASWTVVVSFVWPNISVRFVGSSLTAALIEPVREPFGFHAFGSALAPGAAMARPRLRHGLIGRPAVTRLARTA